MTIADNAHHAVLVVDNETDVLQTSRSILLKQGYEVFTASNGDEALDVLATAAPLPAAVLTAAAMPDMDGLTLCRRIKEVARTSHVPVILASEQLGTEDARKWLDAGIADCIKKPINGTELAIRLHTQIALHRAMRAQRQSEARLEQILDNVPVGIMLVDHQKRVRWCNQQAADMAQVADRTNLHGKPCTDWFCPADKDKCPVLDLRQSINRSERILKRSDGSQIPILKSVDRVELGNEPLLLEAFLDTSEQKRLEAELGQARKLEAVGQLAAGIAHEIHTPAQYISDNLFF
jgi:two-component system NtrC family sensor kinase